MAGRMRPGPLNLITDVSGLRVGHVTISGKEIQAGVVWTGSNINSGSGEIIVTFSTAIRIRPL